MPALPGHGIKRSLPCSQQDACFQASSIILISQQTDAGLLCAVYGFRVGILILSASNEMDVSEEQFALSCQADEAAASS
jgi:hypothetical protein